MLHKTSLVTSNITLFIVVNIAMGDIPIKIEEYIASGNQQILIQIISLQKHSMKLFFRTDILYLMQEII